MTTTQTRAPRVLLNGGGTSVARQLDEWLELGAGHLPGGITFVTSFLTFRGLMLLTRRIRALIERGHRVQILMGVAPDEFVSLYRLARIDATGPEPAQVAALSSRVEDTLRAELDHIPLGKDQLLRLQDLARLLDGPRLHCRRYQRGYLHAKAVIIDHDRDHSHDVQAIVGSSNFTRAGFTTNREINSVVAAQDARAIAATVAQWWQQAEPYDLAQLVWDRFLAYPPALVFLRMLHEVHGDEVNAPPSHLGLLDYQRDGVAKVRTILRRYRGALIGDAVGLGKTFIAGEVARLAIQSGEGPVKIVVPTSLVATWQDRLTTWGVNCELISYRRLVNQYKKVEDEGHTWPPCGLLIVDEAHALRNPLTKGMLAARSLLEANPHAQIVLISATPVNNHEGDLMELLLLADPELEPNWIPEETDGVRRTHRSLEGQRLWKVLREVSRGNASQADRGWFYDVLERRILRRDRIFIRHAYPDSDLSFPTLDPQPVYYRLTDHGRRLLTEVLDSVGPVGLSAEQAEELAELRGEAKPGPQLTFAVYQRTRYLLADDSPALDGAATALSPLLIRWIRLMLCKRLESSAAALSHTVDYVKAKTQQALADLDQGVVRLPCKPGLPRRRKDVIWALGDGDAIADLMLEPGKPEDYQELPAHLFDIPTMRADLDHDLRLLTRLADLAHRARQEDPKRSAVAKLILRALADPRGPKVVIFASARASTHDLGMWLEALVEKDDRFAKLRGRIVNTGVFPPPDDPGRTDAMARFAPDTAQAPSRDGTIPPKSDDYDVLICTDMLAEGVNLQQAAFCINYDLTWNPQRLGQRIGRLSRINSAHSKVTCWTILPDTGLDLVLSLMDRLIMKAETAKETVGVPDPLFPDCPTGSYTSLGRWARNPEEFPDLLDGLVDDDPLRDHGWNLAWLGNAQRLSAVRQAITGLPRGAGAVHPDTFTNPGVVYCFSITDASGRRAGAAFAHVYAGARHGATVLDTAHCLRHARLDPTDWITSVDAAGKPPAHTDYPPMPDTHLALVGDLLDHARAAIADARGIPAALAAERIQLITWMVLPAARPARTRR
ncbi:hypothetical protein GCM10023088_51540 [Actinomadura verrucosospora]|uniref:helicase-related protein n=1 Tax=Actinomadura verrucosospora TaxID=46165 RepID=UPI0031E82A97